MAESFSGPVAVRIAARQELAGLVLVGSFVTPPLPPLLRGLPLTTMARLQVPDWMLSFWILSPYATAAGVRDFREAIGVVRPRVLASRIRPTLGRAGDAGKDARAAARAAGRRDRLVLRDPERIAALTAAAVRIAPP